KVERILFNLISNAFKFTREGGQVSVKMDLDEEAQSPAVRIQVADTGIGIAREDQERIFERFFQSETPGNMVNQGSGIGLSIAREFVRLHGGAISVESEPDKGSCFTDRKSTRLNSSHVKISYAVFCLKKKKRKKK